MIRPQLDSDAPPRFSFRWSRHLPRREGVWEILPARSFLEDWDKVFHFIFST
jgi:hypothetical protein